MRQSIRINKTEINLSTSQQIATTKRVANIGTLKRQSSFTNKLSLLNTATNRTACGLVQGNDNSDLKYSRQIGAVISNGVEILPNAEFTIEAQGDVIDILINAGNSVFFDLASKRKLRTIDMVELDHVWNMQNEFDSIPHTWVDGYIYGIHDTGNQSRTINNMQCQGVVPQVFAKYVLNKIAEEYGYAIEGAFYDDLMLDDLVLSIAEARTGKRIQDDVKIVAQKISPQSIDPIFDNNYFVLVRNWEFNTFDKWGVWNVNSPWSYEIKFPGKYTFTVNYSATVTNTTPALEVDARYRLRCTRSIDGVVNVLSSAIEYVTVLGAHNGSLSILVDLTDEIVVRQNSWVFVSFEIFQKSETNLNPEILTIWDTSNVLNLATFITEFIDAPNSHYNRPINIQESLPDWTCGKFINEVCNIGGVIPVVSEFDKIIYLNTINEIVENKIIAKQWQSKLDLSTTPKYTFKVDGYGRRMDFKYKQDDRYRHSINVANEQLPDEVDYIKSDFAYSVPAQILGKSWGACGIPLWDASKLLIKWDKNSYLFLIERKAGHVTYTSYSETNVNAAPGTLFPWCVFQESATYPYQLIWKYLYQRYYLNVLSGVIDNIVVVDALFRLDEFDIDEFDFRIPIYLQDPNGYYFVQSIKEFTTSNDSTNVELLRIG